jgi:hypothetical protein
LYAFIANASSKKSYVENLHKNCHHTAALAAFGFLEMEINRKMFSQLSSPHNLNE